MHAGHQIAHRHRHDARFTQRGQHLLDVAQKQARGPHQQHAGSFQALAVGVEEVGDAVQGNGCLAGSRASLDDEEALIGRADNTVLLGLDGGDDVAHVPVARLAESVHESSLALKL